MTIPGIGPEHAHLADIGRAEYHAIGDEDVIAALQLLSEKEGIIPALETAHAVAWLAREAGRAVPTAPPCCSISPDEATRTSPKSRRLLRGES